MTPEHAQACRTVLNTFLHHPAESDTNEGNKTVGDVNNDDKLVVLRTTKRMTSPAQLSTLVGGEKRLKAFVRAAKIEEVYAGVALIAVELSFAKSKNKVKGRALVDQLRSEICRVTGEAVCMCRVAQCFIVTVDCLVCVSQSPRLLMISPSSFAGLGKKRMRRLS
jgi:hypothetical protein